MTRRAGRWVLLAAAVLTAGIAGAENKFDYCLLCHGDNANGNYGIRAPKLSGMEPWYLARQLENFAAGIRGTPAEDASGHEMMPVGLRVKQEAVLAAAVAWIGTLQSKKPILTVSGDVAHGRQLYQTCVACHGARGQGNAELQAPALASRSDWYLITQLRNFKAGLRGVDERDTLGAQMRAISASLPDDQAI
ncbi:MAG: c-type cytochrome, partial [Peristeroidobacter soli]